MKQSNRQALLFSAAADLISGRRQPEDALIEPARRLLSALGLPWQPERSEQRQYAAVPNMVELLEAAAHLLTIFRIPVPDAPGLVFIGGEADPRAVGIDAPAAGVASLAGAALAPPQAFAACVGEGIEYLSQFARSGDQIHSGHDIDKTLQTDVADRRCFAEWLGLPTVAALDDCPTMPAHRLDNGATVAIPAELVLRGTGPSRERLQPSFPLGTGCSAGATHARATAAALLEVIERDAMALWWMGGQPARSISTEVLQRLGALDFLAALRRQCADRETRLFDISTDLGVPCVAAVSFTADGTGFAAGFAADIDPRRAVRSALIELCQAELGLRLAALKRRQRGDDKLNDADRRQLQRAARVRLSDIRADGTAKAWEVPDTVSDEARVEAIVGHLARAGYVAYFVDLTREEFRIPVVRALVPGLQPFPSNYLSERLRGLSPQGQRDTLWAEGVDLL